MMQETKRYDECRPIGIIKPHRPIKKNISDPSKSRRMPTLSQNANKEGDGMKKININVDEKTRILNGSTFGSDIFKEQIYSNISTKHKNVIVFPKSIKHIGIAFIEGMLLELPNNIERKEFYKYFSVEGDEKVVDKFRRVVMMKD